MRKMLCTTIIAAVFNLSAMNKDDAALHFDGKTTMVSVTPQNYEIPNGLLGMERDVVLRLIRSVAGCGKYRMSRKTGLCYDAYESVRNVIGMERKLYFWSKQRLFVRTFKGNIERWIAYVVRDATDNKGYCSCRNKLISIDAIVKAFYQKWLRDRGGRYVESKQLWMNVFSFTLSKNILVSFYKNLALALAFALAGKVDRVVKELENSVAYDILDPIYHHSPDGGKERVIKFMSDAYEVVEFFAEKELIEEPIVGCDGLSMMVGRCLERMSYGDAECLNRAGQQLVDRCFRALCITNPYSLRVKDDEKREKDELNYICTQ
ncbi:hypothetical protein FACS189449_11750 [Alphaproteobacteria bacterium]|nr:hypothetical protein FACS189449_11750 [Alphaproteobacteria bacterium]